MTDYSNSPRDATRVPIAHRIQLKFDRFSGFINEYVSNISPGGIFIRTDSPEAPGQLLEFEFRLGDGFELIRGRGEVVWTRDRPEGPERPSGMGVRFLELSAGSKDLIYKIVDDYVAHGGKPFDLAGLPGKAGAPQAAGLGDAPGVSWNLEIPAIRPVPGVPVITPRSPLEALAAGGGGNLGAGEAAAMDWHDPALSPPGGQASRGSAERDRQSPLLPSSRFPGPPPPPPPSAGAYGAPSAVATSELPTSPMAAWSYPNSYPDPGPAAGDTATFPVADAAGAFGAPAAAGVFHQPGGDDPLARLNAELPPLDELTAVAPPPFPPVQPDAPPPPPAFAAFNHGERSPRRRSRLGLIGLLVAVGAVATSIYLLRDSLLQWIDHTEATVGGTRIAGGSPPAAAGGLVLPRRQRTPPPVFPEFSPSKRDARHGGAAAASGGAAAVGGPLGATAAPLASPRSAASSPAASSGAPPAPATATAAPSSSGAARAAGASGAASSPAASRPPSPGAPVGAPAASMPSPLPPPPLVRAKGAAPGVQGAAAAGAQGGAGTPSAAAGLAASTAPSTVSAGIGASAGTSGGAASARVTAIQRITWEASHGSTDLVLWGNGDFPAGSWSQTRIGGPGAREVIRITGITRPFSPSRLGVNTPEVLQVRTGLHPPQELHVVLDLGRPDVGVTGIEAGPHRLRIHLGAK